MAITIPSADNFNRVSAVGGRGAQTSDTRIATRAAQQAVGIMENADQGVDQANQRFANVVQQEAGEWGKIAQQEQERVQKVRFEDARNQLDQKTLDLTSGEKGFSRVEGTNAIDPNKPLIKEYGDQHLSASSEIGKNLTGDAKIAFEQYAKRSSIQFQAGVLQHQMRQADIHEKEVRVGSLATAGEIASRNYADPLSVLESKQRVKSIYQDDLRNGTAPELVDANTFKAVSEINTKVLNSALLNDDIGFAEKYLKDNAKEMQPETAVRFNGLIQEHKKHNLAVSVGNDSVSRVIQEANPSDAKQAFNILLQTESNGQQFGKAGNVVTSPKGAKGIAQVMPDTWPEARKLAGLPSTASIDDPNDNRAAGQAYFNKQLQDNAGDVQKAWAAYNAGPTALKKAEAAAEKNNRLAANDPAIGTKTYLDFLPQETQDYVAKNSKAYAGGSGQVVKQTLENVYASVESDPRMKDQPIEVVQAAKARAKAAFNEANQQQKQGYEDALDDLRAKVNDGTYKSWADVPVAARNAIGPNWGPAQSYINSSQERAGDSLKHDPIAVAEYNRLALDSDTLVNASVEQIYKLAPTIGQQNVDKLVTERLSLKKDQAKLDDAKNFESAFRVQALNYDVGGKWTDDTHIRMQASIKDAIQSEEVAKGRKLTIPERDALIVKGVQKETLSRPWYMPDASSRGGAWTLDEIPKDIRSKAEKYLADAYKKNPLPQFAPTDANIIRLARTEAQVTPRGR